MKKIEEEKIELIKNSNDIIDVLSNYVSLIKKGKNYVCLCPFHNDSNPSMVVSQEKQIYKCFSCDAGGNVIKFVQDFEKISFVEALLKLAQKANIELDVDTSTSNSYVNENYKEYYLLNQEANNLFEYLMIENKHEITMSYLDDRKISSEIAKKFKIGYASTNNSLKNLFEAKGYNLNTAVELGLLSLKDNEYKDTLSDRITYAISDINNNVVGFTCRALNNATPKYINSIESKIFNKSKILYNINNAKESIKQSKRVYILEGPNDVIAFEKAGIYNVVATMGTAFTNQHISLLKSIGVVEVVLGFDGDEAGIKATYNAINTLSNSNINVKYISFDKLDPDEYLNKNGYQKFNETIKASLSAIEFKINYEFSLINTNNYQEKKNVVKKLVTDLNKTLDEFDKEYYYNYLANLSGISYELISSLKADNNIQVNAQSRKPTSNITSKKTNDIDNASSNILYFMMHDRKYLEIFNDEIGSFINSEYRRMYNVIAAFYINNEQFNISASSNLNASEDLIKNLMKILLSFEYESYNDEQIFLDSIMTLKLEAQYLELESLNKKLINIQDPIEKSVISQKIIELSSFIKQEKRMKFNK